MLKRIRKSAVRSEMCKDRALAQVWIESKAIKCKERATCSCVGAGEPHHSTSESVRLYYTGSIVIVSIPSLSSICTFSTFILLLDGGLVVLLQSDSLSLLVQ
jgi:hypothetical protein